jgi:aspartyl-tRNA(Asn)/glutamyl-tRNA(Gln) amidotransferase subunit B
MNFETIIGIEIHCELNTKTKMFSSAPNSFGKEPNTQVSKVDMAFPGILPTVNKKAVEYAIMACSALNLSIDNELWFDRKNYFYSDLPKGFQITQDKRPIGRDGYIEVDTINGVKRIGIERIHMEEDTAKQSHYGDYTLIDYNRCGVPLIEIVSKPDMRSGEEAAKYVEKLRSILSYLGVSDCKMEEGSMRCDINISLRPIGSEKFGVKTEIKNLNSINNIQRAVEFEISRQEKLLLKGLEVEQETRRFDEASKQTVLMRKKTDAVDYKYYTEANIMPIILSDAFIYKAINLVPELPDARFNRFGSELNLSEYDARQLINQKAVADYYEEVLKDFNDPKITANWILGDVYSYLNKNNLTIKDFKLSTSNLAKLLTLLKEGKISSKQGKEIFNIIIETNENPETIAKAKGMVQESDEGLIMEYINEVLQDNPQAIATYKSGRDNILGFLVGQVMKKSKGKANPAITSKLLKEEIMKR